MKATNRTVKAKRKYSRSDKMAKTSILLKSSYIRAYIPPTRRMSRTSLLTMLDQYGMVYAKPKKGSLGRGVIRVTKMGSNYKVHIDRTVTTYSSYAAVYQSIIRKTKGESYVVQKGIHSLRLAGRVFDFRVVVQRSPRGGFEVTGVAGRVSQAGRVVSNGGGGGAVGTINSLLTASQRRIVMPKMEKLGVAIMHQVRKRYSNLNEIGIDFVVDSHLKPWIVEFNTRPNHSMFIYLPDRAMIARIISYGRKYGRKYRLKHY